MDCYIDSDESDLSETDIFIDGMKSRTSFCRRLERRETNSNGDSNKPQQVQQKVYDKSNKEEVRSSRRRATSRVSRKASPHHRDYEFVMHERLLERSDFRQDMEVWKQQDEIERLERQLAKTHGKSSPPREVAPVTPRRARWKVYDESDKEEVWSSRRRAASRVAREASPHHCDYEFDMEIWKHQQDIERLERELAKTRGKSSPLREVAPVAPQPLPHGFRLLRDEEERYKDDEQIQAYVAKTLEISGREQGDSASTAAKSNDEERESEDGPQERPSILSTAPQESMTFWMRGGDAQKQTFSEGLSLPGNLEDLLAQWTTLNKQELQRGHVSAF